MTPATEGRAFVEVEPLHISDRPKLFVSSFHDGNHISISGTLWNLEQALALRDWLNSALGEQPDARLIAAVEALREVAEFGEANTGYGHSCAKLARKALAALGETHD